MIYTPPLGPGRITARPGQSRLDAWKEQMAQERGRKEQGRRDEHYRETIRLWVARVNELIDQGDDA